MNAVDSADFRFLCVSRREKMKARVTTHLQKSFLLAVQVFGHDGKEMGRKAKRREY